MYNDDRDEPERSLRAYATVLDEAIARNEAPEASGPTDDLTDLDGGLRRRFISGPRIAVIGLAASFLVVGLWAVNRAPDPVVDPAGDEVDGAVAVSSTMTAMPLVYSGLPNPVIGISDDEADRVRAILDRLASNQVSADQVSHDDGLGFIGFQLEHYVHNGQERVVHVSNAGVTLYPVGQDAFSATADTVALADPEGVLYEEIRSIVGRARPDLAEGIPEFPG